MKIKQARAAALGAVFIGCVASTDAAAVTVNTLTGPPTLTVDGACTAASITRFDLAATNMVYTGTTDDAGGRDFFNVYLVDGNNKILFGSVSSIASAGVAVQQGASFDTSVDPDAGPFRIVVTEDTDGFINQANGATLAQTALRTLSFDASALDADCPAGTGGAESGGISRETAFKILISALSKGISLEGLVMLQRHLDRITFGGLMGNRSIFTPGAPNTGNLAAPGNAQAAISASASAVTAGFSQDSGAVFGTSDTREMARMLLPYLRFDTADVANAATESGTVGPTPDRLGGRGADRGFNLFLDTGYKIVDNDRFDAAGDQRFSGDILSISFGGDAWLRDDVLVGAYVNFADAAVDTTFNDGTYEENSWTVAPYVLVQPTDWSYVSLTLGYSISSIDQSRGRSANVITSSPDASAMFASLDGKAVHDFDGTPLRLSAIGGFTASRKTVDGYTDSASTAVGEFGTHSGQLRAGGEASYLHIDGSHELEPFAKAQFQYEFRDLTNSDPSDVLVGAGVRYFHSALDLSLSIDGTTLLAHDDYTEHSLAATLAKGFDTDLFGGGRLTPQAGLQLDSVLATPRLGLGFLSDDSDLAVDLGSQMNIAKPEDDEGRRAIRTDLKATLRF